MSARTIILKIKRQKNPELSAVWEEFKVIAEGEISLLALLQKIREQPINARNEAVDPIVWGGECDSRMCGDCGMLVNGQPMLACEFRLKDFDQLITLEPLTRFPVIRDLWVDRSIIEKNLKELQLWKPVDRSVLRTLASQVAPSVHAEVRELSQCIECGLCLEVCPQFNERSSFIGPQAIAMAHEHLKKDRLGLNRDQPLTRLMQKGGVADCGDAQNCVKVCPKEIPLTTSIASMKREVVKEGFKRFFG